MFSDQLIGGFIEPIVVGHRVGVSPMALLLAAIFWGWLWGPVGLLLATPITVCLTVGGEFIPALRIFSIMFGSEDPLEGYLSFYNRLLLRDRTGAIAIADRYAETATMEEMFNDLFIPTLTFAQEELDRKRITQAHDHFIKDVIRELIIRFGDRNAGTPDPLKHIVAVSVAGERLSLGTLMLTQLLRSEGYRADYFTDLPEQELVAFINEVKPEAVFVSCANMSHLEQGYALLQLLSANFPELGIVAGGSAFSRDKGKTLERRRDVRSSDAEGSEGRLPRPTPRRAQEERKDDVLRNEVPRAADGVMCPAFARPPMAGYKPALRAHRHESFGGRAYSPPWVGGRASARWPSEPPSTQQMEVDVKHRLPRAFAVVDDEAVAVGVEAEVVGEGGGADEGFAHRHCVGFGEVVERGDVASRDDEDVRRRLRVDVVEGDRVGVFEDFLRGDLAVGDAAEQAVSVAGHAGIIRLRAECRRGRQGRRRRCTRDRVRSHARRLPGRSRLRGSRCRSAPAARAIRRASAR